jgi:hypothetical protein
MKIHPMFHVSLLEPYHTSTIPRKIHDPFQPINVDVEQEYEMQDICIQESLIVNFSILFIGMGMM